MPGESKNGMQCAEFDALLSEALDQMLHGPQLERFEAHLRVCPLCGPLWAEAEEGRRLLTSLEEVEPPHNLVPNILIATTGLSTARLGAAAQPRATWLDRVHSWFEPVIAPVWALARQPKFAMSFGMAFFTLSLVLSMTGVKVRDLAKIDLRPSAIRRNYYETSGRVVKYYENIRFVYEIQSRVQEFKRATNPAEPGPREQNNKDRKNNTSGQPEQKQERNYSQGDVTPVLAAAPDVPPEVPVTTSRRFS